jgi:hypothetical protein
MLMNRSISDIKQIITMKRDHLNRRYGVKRIGIFGSYVHGTQSEVSDIDILVELEEPLGYEFIGLQMYLEEILGRKVDLVTVKALKPRMREHILREVVYT